MTPAISRDASASVACSASSPETTFTAVVLNAASASSDCLMRRRQYNTNTVALKITTASSSSAEYQTVSRVRRESGTASEKLIALAAARPDDGRRVGIVELPAQPLHVDVHDVRERVVVLVPDVLGDVGAPDDLAGVPGEVFEERVLAAGQRNFTALAEHAAPRHVDRERADFDALGRNRTALAARQRAEPREELAKVERLGQVVIGSGVE